MSNSLKEKALEYHESPRPGKLELMPTKKCANQKDLALAYSPGVAEVCLAIEKKPELAVKYTNKSNLVAVISNGTAVLGLGDIGPLASKPVMEGKGVLFKAFADVDVYDLELNCQDADKIISIVECLEPSFGGINLEDIKAPECFYIEKELQKRMGIPVFHDDQHGTAVISGAALLNAVEIAGKDIPDCKIVIVGAGAAGIACANFYISLGVQKEKLFLFDSKGLIHTGRTDLNPYKKELAQDKNYGSLEEVISGADMFLGLSTANLLSSEMVKSMDKKHPVVLACANPDPEIKYEIAKEARPDCIMGTGRTDYPNQVNNVSGFPFIFRGALDTKSKSINEKMKIAAARSLAALAKEPVPQEVIDMYGGEELSYGLDYVIPKPLDPRLISRIAPAVAEAAMRSGVAQSQIKDLAKYAEDLEKRLENCHQRMNSVLEGYK